MLDKTENLKKKIDATKDAAAETADAAVDVAKDEAVTMVGKLRAVGAEAGTRAEHLRDAAADRIEGAKDALSETGDRLAETLRKAADAGAARAEAAQTKVMTAVADGATAVADTFRDRKLGDLVGDVHDLARRHPAKFAVGAAIAGFALARLFMSSGRGGRSGRDGDAS